MKTFLTRLQTIYEFDLSINKGVADIMSTRNQSRL